MFCSPSRLCAGFLHSHCKAGNRDGMNVDGNVQVVGEGMCWGGFSVLHMLCHLGVGCCLCLLGRSRLLSAVCGVCAALFVCQHPPAPPLLDLVHKYLFSWFRAMQNQTTQLYTRKESFLTITNLKQNKFRESIRLLQSEELQVTVLWTAPSQSGSASFNTFVFSTLWDAN